MCPSHFLDRSKCARTVNPIKRNMVDSVDQATRSRVMAAVRSTGNRSTERRLRSALARSRIRGWRTQASDLPGKPDFVFDDEYLAIFVDGCFWHGCPRCYRRPHSSRKYWDAKVLRNMCRDKRIEGQLRRSGWSILRIWEHELEQPERAIARIRRRIHMA